MSEKLFSTPFLTIATNENPCYLQQTAGGKNQFMYNHDNTKTKTKNVKRRPYIFTD